LNFGWSRNRAGRFRVQLSGALLALPSNVIRCPYLFCRRGPSLKETGEFKIRDSGRRCAGGFLPGAVLSHLGRKAVWPVLDRSSESFIVLCDPKHQVLGYFALHLFRANARLFCACTPLRRIMMGHDAGPCFPIRRNVFETSWRKPSIFAPTWCVDVLWISFFSAKEINTLGKGTLGRPVNSRPARPPPRLHANGRGSDRPPSPAQRVERHRYFRRRPVAESVTVFFGLSSTRSNSPAIRPSSSPPSGARWLGGFLLLAPILFRFPLHSARRAARG
jgi:hypothetical protein